MTATEAALYDMNQSGNLKYWMGTVTHKNLPLSMFLETNDTDIYLTAWTGSSSAKASNYNILYYLGMGLVTFEEREIEVDVEGDYEFRTDTDVIVSVKVTNSGGDITPDDNAYIVLNIGGTIYRKQFVCPGGGNQLIWVKWHTPDEPQKVIINVTSPQIPGLDKDLIAGIVELPENVPPDPTYYDTNPSFSYQDMVDYGSRTSTEWGEWSAYWVEHLVWYDYGDEDNPDAGEWVDEGWWEFEYLSYSASLSATFEITPDSSVPTAYQSRGAWVMPSGYGINANCTVSVSASSSVTNYEVTPTQGVVVLFSEFNYDTYNRLMISDTSTTSTYRNQLWTLKPNEYSFYNSKIHFTPLWYPDDTLYTVEAIVIDAWTPGGVLYQTLSDSITIYQSTLDDWYIHRTK